MSTPSNPSNSNPSNPKRSGRRGADQAGRDYTGFGFREVGSDDALDRYLDKEISRDSAAFRSAFVKREFRERLDEAEGMIGQMRKPLRSPDMSDAILDAVDARKSFVATGTRRVLTVGRLAAAASVLLAVGGVILIERSHPILSAFRSDIEPISGMVSAASLPESSRPAAPILADAGSVPSSDATPKVNATLVGWTLGRLGRVESVEVRRGPESFASVSQSGSAWNVDRSGGMVPVLDISSEWSVGFATFPTPDHRGNVWAARGW